MKHIKRLSLLFACMSLSACVVVVLMGTILAVRQGRIKLRAQVQMPAVATTICGPSHYYNYTGSIDVPAGDYDIYAQLGKSEDGGAVAAYLQDDALGCQVIGNGVVSGSRWTRIGSWSPKGAASGRFVVSTAIETGFITANKPRLLLVPREYPACVPAIDCEVIINGERGKVLSSIAANGFDQLAIGRVVHPLEDKLVSVDYYVDHKPVYSRPVLEPFNERYVGAGAHNVERVATYASGQRIIFSGLIDHGWTNEIPYVIFSFLYGNRSILQLAAGLLFVIAVGWLFITVFRALYRRHLWKAHHFMRRTISRKPPEPLMPGPTTMHYANPEMPLTIFVRLLMPVVAFVIFAAAIVIGSIYAVDTARVDGSSMERTLSSGQYIAISKFGKTIARISGRQYLPNRGEIVVFEPRLQIFLPAASFQERVVIVKRVIGLPGDRVRIRRGLITVFNDAHPDGFNPDEGKPWSNQIRPDPTKDLDITLGPGEIFVCGDNRPQSLDSRSDGPIRSDALLGRVILRVSPFTLL